MRDGYNRRVMSESVNGDPAAFSWPDGKRAAVSLSFDDARPTQADNGLPILDRHGVRASFYVSFGRFEKRLDQWKAALANGHEIGNHTTHHPCSCNYRFVREHALESYTVDQIERDILEANDYLQETVGITPTTFAYPCGQQFVGSGERVQSYVPVIARHFEIGRSFYEQSPNDPARCDLAHAYGCPVDGKTPDEALQMVRDAVAQGGWLILAAHEVADTGRQALPPATLDALCAYCQAAENEIWIDTVETVGRYVRQTRGSN